ncbi:Ig-like domain-containing protein, partial [Shewanella sp. S1-49-MNA-CIBAN-0167]|uniref:Ig-like domain-containing protein n=1 Tax=Shewanella sp. S1-49-MNA-CIBAN-0167 TaxID=3140468 RepID=UPI00331CC507
MNVIPAANQSGSATITITVSDGSLSYTRTFVVTVNAVNDTPTISNISNRSINEDSNTGIIAFTIGDHETAAGSLSVSRSSSNAALVPTANVVLGGSGANRTVRVTPSANQSGSVTISLTVSDGSLSYTRTFVVTVNAVNDAPTISNISNRSINEDSNTGNIAFTIGDLETAAGSLSVSRSSSNAALVPTANVVLGGSGANRTVNVTPAANQSGSTTISLIVSDGSLSYTRTFVVTVNAVNDAPTISNISNRSINE